MSAATDYFFAELRNHLRCAVCGGKLVDAVERRWDLIRCTRQRSSAATATSRL